MPCRGRRTPWEPEDAKIVGIDVNHLLELLNQAYASEWLAYYQY